MTSINDQIQRQIPGTVSNRQNLNLSGILVLVFLVEVAAIGLKIFHDRRNATAAKQVETRREALAVSEYITGKVQSVERTMQIAYQAEWTSAEIGRVLTNGEMVTSLTYALSAPEGTPLRAAGERGAQLLAQDKRAGLTQNADLVIMHAPDRPSARLVLVKGENWLPTAYGKRTFSLKSQEVDGIQPGDMGTITACSPLENSLVSVCVQTMRPLLTIDDAISLAIYALLLLGPVFVISRLLQLAAQKQAEGETLENRFAHINRVFNTVLHEAKAGFWSYDTQKDQFWINDTTARFIRLAHKGHYTRDQLAARIHKDQRQQFAQVLAALPARGRISVRFATEDKASWLDMRGRGNKSGSRFSGVILDITPMHKELMKVDQGGSQLKSALDKFVWPFALWDVKKRLVYWNTPFAQVFGLKKTARVGMAYKTVMMAQAANIRERRLGHASDDTEFIRTHDGTWYRTIHSQTGSGEMVTIGLNVSKDVRYEEELTRQKKQLHKAVIELERSEGHAAELAGKLNEEKLKAERTADSKSAFLANMSHELRTPLNAINGFSEILAAEMYGPLGDNRYKGYAHDILASGQHLLEMINDILDMAKIEAGKMTVELRMIDIVDPVDAAIRIIRRKAEDKDIDLQLVVGENLPMIAADHRAIRQMILNLVSNAIKFTNEGGSIRVLINQTGRNICVAVRDNGIGISAENLSRLAKPFEQVSVTGGRNHEGTGLGLALTKSFAEMHGGRLTITSKENLGTQVSFFLPIQQSDKTAKERAA